MDDFEAYKTYVSLKSHFNNKNYDYFKYNGKNKKISYDTFLKRNDKIFFKKLSKHKDVIGILVSNFLENKNNWIKELAYNKDSEQVYKDWLKRNQSLSYMFKQDISKLDENFNSNFIIKDNQHPYILKLYYRKDISIESLCILFDIVGCKSYFDKKLSSDIIWQETSMLIEKYTPFIKYDKERIVKICLDTFDSM